MLSTTSFGGGGFGGGGFGGGDPPKKWTPDDKAGFLMYFPRTKGAGGKHFLPANWIDRLLALAVSQANLGGLLNMASSMQDMLGDEQPLEVSSYRVTNYSKGPYVSMTDKTEKGVDQVFTNLRQRFRELGDDIFSDKIASSGDGGGRRIDMPDAPSSELARRLAIAAQAIINFFNQHIIDHDAQIQMPMEGGDQMLSWRDIRAIIEGAINTIMFRGHSI